MGSAKIDNLFERSDGSAKIDNLFERCDLRQ